MVRLIPLAPRLLQQPCKQAHLSHVCTPSGIGIQDVPVPVKLH